MTKKWVTGLELSLTFCSKPQRLLPIALNHTTWKLKAPTDPNSGKRLKLNPPFRFINLSTFQRMLVYKHCHTLCSLPCARHHVLANTVFLAGAEEVMQVSCECRTEETKSIRTTHFTYFCPDSRNLSYSTDILQQRACRVWTAEQLVLIIWSPRKTKISPFRFEKHV